MLLNTYSAQDGPPEIDLAPNASDAEAEPLLHGGWGTHRALRRLRGHVAQPEGAKKRSGEAACTFGQDEESARRKGGLRLMVKTSCASGAEGHPACLGGTKGSERGAP